MISVLYAQRLDRLYRIMQFAQDHFGGKNLIKHYDDKSITIDSMQFELPIMIDKENIMTESLPANFEALSEDFIKSVLSYNPELILIGCGENSLQLNAKISAFILQHHVGVEVMTTAAACRTFNVLLSEDRKVCGLFF